METHLVSSACGLYLQWTRCPLLSRCRTRDFFSTVNAFYVVAASIVPAPVEPFPIKPVPIVSIPIVSGAIEAVPIVSLGIKSVFISSVSVSSFAVEAVFIKSCFVVFIGSPSIVDLVFRRSLVFIGVQVEELYEIRKSLSPENPYSTICEYYSRELHGRFTSSRLT